MLVGGKVYVQMKKGKQEEIETIDVSRSEKIVVRYKGIEAVLENGEYNLTITRSRYYSDYVLGLTVEKLLDLRSVIDALFYELGRVEK